MNLRLLTILLAAAGALWAPAPAAVAAGGGGEPGSGGKAVPDAKGTEPNAPAAPQEQPAGTPDQTSTSPGGNAQGSGDGTTAPGAPASPTTDESLDGEIAPDCDPSAGLRRALRSLRRAARGRRLLTRRPRAFGVRVRPCMPGTFELSIVEARTGVVLWRARRELRTTQRATLRMTMTRPGRRFVARSLRGKSRRVRMRLRARLTP